MLVNNAVIYDRKLFLRIIPVLFLVTLLIAVLVYKNLNPKNEGVVVRVGDNYQKIIIPSGDIAEVSSIEKESINDLSGLPDKKDKEFYKNYTVLHSDNKDKILVTSFLGQGENAGKQKEFICDLSKKECSQENFFFKSYKSGNRDIMSQSVWWLGWNSKDNKAIGLTTNEVNNGTLFVCDKENQICNENPKDKLNFPQGAINNSFTKVVAIRQNDIINEKTGDKWELLLYDLDNLVKPMKTYDISSAIDRNEDIFYDGVNSIAWSKNNKTILIGTMRNIFKLNLNNGKLDKIFTDISNGDDDFYWNSDKINFSPSERYVIFIDSFEKKSSAEKQDEDADLDTKEGILKAIDLKDDNKVIELFQAKDLVLK